MKKGSTEPFHQTDVFTNKCLVSQAFCRHLLGARVLCLGICFHKILTLILAHGSPSLPSSACFPFVRRTHSYHEEEDAIGNEKEQRKEDNRGELPLVDWFNPE